MWSTAMEVVSGEGVSERTKMTVELGMFVWFLVLEMSATSGVSSTSGSHELGKQKESSGWRDYQVSIYVG